MIQWRNTNMTLLRNDDLAIDLVCWSGVSAMG
jgi:hypothetical protein